MNRKIIECQTLNGVNRQSGSESTPPRRVVKPLRVLIPAVCISIMLIACADTTDNTTDTTSPAVSGIRISTSAATSVTVTVNTNGAGKLFWVAYANGTSPPTTSAALITVAGQTPSSTIIATSGSDGQAVPAAGVQTVTISGLSVTTDYDVYVVFQDADNNTSSISVKLDIATVVPIVNGIRVSTSAATSVTVIVNTNETGKLFWVAYADGTTSLPATPAALIIAAGEAKTAPIVANSGSDGQTVSAAGVQTVTISGLSATTDYDVYLVVQDVAGNISSISAKLDIATVSMFTASIYGSVTVLCPDADVGDIGTVHGITYTKRAIGAITPANAATTCTSGITNMSNLFENNATFNADIRSWDVSRVTNMTSMFSGATIFNQDIDGWNVSRVTNMSNMFLNALAFNKDIGSWNVGSVTDMSSMFSGATVFNKDIGRWHVSRVTNMSSMFLSAPAFDQNIGSWDVSTVRVMTNMFNAAAAFEQNIGSWNVSSVVSMGSMFNGATIFNQNISGWDVSTVSSMTNMFTAAAAFNQDLSTWCVKRIAAPGPTFSDGSFAAETAKQPRWGVTTVSSCPS